MYVVQNTGTATAYEVHVNVPGAVSFDPPTGELELPSTLAPRESLTFGAVLAWGSDDMAVVSWVNTEGSEHRETWRRPLPPEPKT